MSPYINTQTKEYPLFEGDLALINVDPENLPSYIEKVVVEIPDYDEMTETIYEETPQRGEDGKYYAVIKVKKIDEKEFKRRLIEKTVRKVINGEKITEEEAQLLINR